MATRKSYLERPSYIYLGEERESSISPYNQFEFDEADVWNNSNEVVSSEAAKYSIPNSRSSKRLTKKGGGVDRRPIGAAMSLPVSVPDWSKILPAESQRRENDDNDDHDHNDEREPPHLYLARTRTASFSVHEGIGRTLKGRDMSRVRNAIWKQIGFED